MSEGKGLFFIFIAALVALVAGLYWFRDREKNGEPGILDWTPPQPKSPVDKMRQDQENNGIYSEPPSPTTNNYPAAAPADIPMPVYTPPMLEPAPAPEESKFIISPQNLPSEEALRAKAAAPPTKPTYPVLPKGEV